MDPKLSDPGATFVEKSKRLPFHELSKDTPETLNEVLAEQKPLQEASKPSTPSETDSESEKYGTITFRDDSLSLAELKSRSLPRNPILAFLARSAEKFPGFFFRLSRFFRGKFLWGIAAILIAILLGAAVWGATWYVREIKTYSTLSVLPLAPDFAFEVNIDADSDEYALLEKYASAFPGYALLKKSLDPVGEGKTLSKAIQDSLKRFNLDFDGDLKSVLGDSAYVVVSDMSPVGESLQRGVIAYGASTFREMSRLLSPEREQLASLSRPTVLGDMTVRGVENDFAPEKPLDFLVASPVRDRKRAFDALEKLRSNAEFETEKLRYRGLSYFKVSFKSKADVSPDDLSRFVRFRTLYHALVGGNWVFGSSEEELKRILDRQAERQGWELIISRPSTPTLANNDEFRAVREELGAPNISESLVHGYFNVASETFFKKPSCSGVSCGDMTEYFRSPERIVLGWSIGVTEEGIDMRWSNKTEDEALPGKPESERFSSLLPQKSDEKWINIFSEHDGLKDRFYNFKRMRLTDAGREAWEEARDAIRVATNIDIERDGIDHLSDSVAFSVLTARGVEPEGVWVARVDDPQSTRVTIEKVVEFVRNMLTEQRTKLDATTDIYANLVDSWCSESANTKDCIADVNRMREGNDTLKQKLSAMIDAAHLTETVTPEGTIYSFKLSDDFPYSFASFDFGFRDGVLVLGTHFAAVRSFLHEMGSDGTEKKLASSDFYQKVRSASAEASYQSSFVVMAGVWDVIRYLSDVATKALSEGGMMAPTTDDSADTRREVDDSVFAIGALLRTVKLVGSDSVSRNGFETSSFRATIEALPLEERQRAERILERISSRASVMDSY